MNPRTLMTTTRPHQLHFDPRAFSKDGNRVCDKGSLAKMRPKDADRVLDLMQAVHKANKKIREILKSKGHVTKQSQAHVMRRLRNGWRPRK